MPRGGAREGAGRRAGGVNTKHAEIAAQAAAEGVTPLAVMLDNMRFYHQGAGEALAKLLGGELPEVEAAEGEDAGRLSIIEGIKEVLGLRNLSGVEAARAAPFMHPRFGQIDDGAGGGQVDEVPLSERLQEYQRRDDIAAAGDKVVELKQRGGQ